MRQGRAKMLREALDYKRDEIPEDPLYAALREGEYEPYLKDDKRDWVEEHLQKMRDSKEKSDKETTSSIEEVLFPPKFLKVKDFLYDILYIILTLVFSLTERIVCWVSFPD